ncbi:hypothetical protein ATANTOWER_001689 [Ataeniobius toweri]|uniref:Uncharacterized protein n=1 Tax=Ataeniobius toweri TaxID=208326 RepID=A0ABU7B6P5_9TELE|nr:hypothetical protein [Ataeniobius toweri]
MERRSERLMRSSHGGGGGTQGGVSCGDCGLSSSVFVAVFSFSSLLLLRCLLPPPPPTAHPPASPLHHLRFTGSPYLRRSVGTLAHGKEQLVSVLVARQRGGGVPEDGSPIGALSWLLWLRGEAVTSCFPAPMPPLLLMLMLMLLSGRRNRQWDRSPSSALTSHAAGARSPHLRMGAPLTSRCASPALVNVKPQETDFTELLKHATQNQQGTLPEDSCHPPDAS